MSYKNFYLNLVILFLAISCAGQHNEPKKEISNNSKTTNSQPEKQQLAPIKENRNDYASGEILVKFKKGTEDQAIKAIQEELQIEIVRLVNKPNLYLMKVLDESSVEYVIERLQHYKAVEYAEPNYQRRINNTEP